MVSLAAGFKPALTEGGDEWSDPARYPRIFAIASPM